MKKTLQFKWNPEITENFVKCIQNYKTMMCYKSKDFGADRPVTYMLFREGMACIYGRGTKEDGHFFSPEKPYEMLFNGEEGLSLEVLSAEKPEEKETNKSIKQTILEKIKVCQKFSNAITTGTRSGSGKVILEHFDTLSEIYDGSPAVQSFNFGVDTCIENSGGESSQRFQVESIQNTTTTDNDNVEAENVYELKSNRSVRDEQ